MPTPEGLFQHEPSFSCVAAPDLPNGHVIQAETPRHPEVDDMQGSWLGYSLGRYVLAAGIRYPRDYLVPVTEGRNPDILICEVPTADGTVAEAQIHISHGAVWDVLWPNPNDIDPDVDDAIISKLDSLPPDMGGRECVAALLASRQLDEIEKIPSDAPLGSSDLALLYEVNALLPNHPAFADLSERASKIRTGRFETDRPELMNSVLPEAISLQEQTAYDAYSKVAETFAAKGYSPVSKENFHDLFVQQFQIWQTGHLYEYLVDLSREGAGAGFTLVATPNMEAGMQTIIELAETFGPGVHIDRELREGYECDPAILSGRVVEGPVRFTIIPQRGEDALRDLPMPQQELLQRDRETRHPGLWIGTISALEAVTHWFALRERGFTDGKGDEQMPFGNHPILVSSFIHHENLPPIIRGGHADARCLPLSYISDEGQPALTAIPDDQGTSGHRRFAVG